MTRSEDIGKLVLRLALGILILLHGVHKVRTGVDGISSMLVAHGLPGFVAYLVYVGEIIAPVLLIVGVYSRAAASVIAINMLFAFFLVHQKELFALNGSTGGWALELQGMFLFGAIATAFLGAGRLSLAGGGGRMN